MLIRGEEKKDGKDQSNKQHLVIRLAGAKRRRQLLPEQRQARAERLAAWRASARSATLVQS